MLLDVLEMAPEYLTEAPSWVLKRGACKPTKTFFKEVLELLLDVLKMLLDVLDLSCKPWDGKDG